MKTLSDTLTLIGVIYLIVQALLLFRAALTGIARYMETSPTAPGQLVIALFVFLILLNLAKERSR